MSARGLLLLRALSAALALAAGAGCLPSLTFYEVTRTPTVECDIFPQGDFCDELSPPVTELWTVELSEGRTFVYVDEEVWIADGVEGERTIVKRSIVTRDPGPCTTTSERVLQFDEDGLVFNGTLDVLNRISGPEACGQTPRGSSARYELAGQMRNAP